MARNWTSAQSAAMSTLGRTLLISAAAGSGKTATLTERIIRRLTDPEHPADLSRMLIVTFTRAAAAELKERISSALSDAIAKDPGNRHLQKQLIGLGGAHISTIDAFCREPVKANFAALGLPSSTRIADEAELRPLCERVMGEIIDEYYLKYADASRGVEAFSLLWENPFADLCDSLTPSKNDAELIPTFLSLYDRLLSFPEELGRLKTEAEELRHASKAEYFDFFSTRHGGILKTYIAEFVSHGISVMESALDLIGNDEKALKAYGPAFATDLDFCRLLGETTSYQEAYQLFTTYQNQRLGSLRNPDPEFVKAKDMRTDLVEDIKAIRDTFFRDSSQIIREQMVFASVLCDVLYDFLTEYDRRILDEKKSRGICDFTDNRRFLLKLLESDDKTASPLALEFRERFDEVYIDEYQDVDEMQDTIFKLIGGDHRFMVGDIKQSIYGFRGADPSVFARYRRDLRQMYNDNGVWKGDDSCGNSIFMSDNFRCDESVIRTTNAICGHMFRGCPGSINYQSEDDLGFSKLKPTEDYVSPIVSVNVLVNPPRAKGDEPATDAGELSGVEAEATFVAGEISRLLRERTPLANGEPIKPSDIVILMRNRRALPAYVKALTDLGIPTGSEELEAAEAGRDLFHGTDMSYLVNLLRVMDNPDMDIPLSEILRAPFPGLSLEELILVRRVGDRMAESRSLYMGVEEYPNLDGADPVLSAKLKAFTAWLERYRRMSATQSADGLLRLLQRDDACSCTETPAFRFMYEAARNCRTSSFVSLNAFLRYFESKLANAKNAPVPEGKGAGHVSIMTIHKSKGLEFPVCFVVRCGQYFSARSYSSDMIFEKRAGVSLKLYRRKREEDVTHQAKTDTTLRTVSALAVRMAEREEEMRVLYVAMTRARERLYLVGMGNGKPFSFKTGDRYATLSCNTYLKWILAGLDAHPDIMETYASLSILPAEDICPGEAVNMVEIDRKAEMDREAVDRYTAILENMAPPTALEMALRHVPTKVPASRMKNGLLDECVFYDTDLIRNDGKLPDGEQNSWCDAQSLAAIRQSLDLMKSSGDNEFELLLTENRRPTASEKGTAAHLFLQFCSYDHVKRHGVENEINRLLEHGFINSRTAKILDRVMLEKFFASQFFDRLYDAETIKREFRFSRFVPLSQLTANKEFAEALGERTLLVQGSIDLLSVFPDGHIELCDYKTDRILPHEQKDISLFQKRMQESHGEQLSQYAVAVEETFGTKPTKAFIYSLPLGEAVEIILP